MALRALRPEEVPSAIWLQKPPPLCTGVETCIYRGVQSNVRLIPAQFLRPQDVGAGGFFGLVVFFLFWKLASSNRFLASPKFQKSFF